MFFKFNRLQTPNIAFKFQIFFIIIVLLSILINPILTFLIINTLIISIWLSYLPIRIISGTISNILTSIFIQTLLLGAIAMSASLFNPDFPLSISPIALFIVFSLSVIIHLLTHRASIDISFNKKTFSFTRIDFASISIALLVMLVIILPPFLKYGWQGGVLGQINGNVDDSVHLALINDRVHFDQDYFLDNDPFTIRTQDKISYPASWHTGNSIWLIGLFPEVTPGFFTSILYIITKIFWTFVLLFFFTKTILMNTSRFKIRTDFFIVFLTIFFGYIVAISQYYFGFYNFIPQIIMLFLLSNILLDTSITNNQKKLVLFGAILVFGGGISWYLLIPVLLAILFLIIYTSFSKNNLHNTLKTMFTSIFSYPLLYLILLLSTINCLLISTSSAESLGFVGNLILPGAVIQYTQLFYIGVTLGLALFLSGENKKHLIKTRSSFITIGTLIIFSTFILSIQLVEVQEPRYYYLKIITAIVTLLLPFVIIGFSKIGITTNKVFDHTTSFIIKMSILCVICISSMYLVSGMDLLRWAKGTRSSDRVASSQIIESIEKGYKHNSDLSAYYTFFYSPNSQSQNFINSLLAKSNSSDSTCFRSTLNILVFQDSLPDMLNNAMKQCQNFNVRFVVPSDYINSSPLLHTSLPNNISITVN